MLVPIPSMRLGDKVGSADQVRIRNKAKLRAMELVDPRNTELRIILQKAEFAQTAGADIVEQDDDDDDGPTGSASDSD